MNKRLCDSIMAFVVDHGQGAKFGVNGVVSSFERKAPQTEVIEALDYLLDNRFLKYLGQYTFGLGVGTYIQPYSFNDFATDAFFPKPSAEHLLAYQQLFVADTGKPPKKPKTPKKAKTDKPAKPSMDIPSFSGSVSFKGDTAKRKPQPDVFAEIDQLSHKLKSTDIKDRELKCSVLDRLAKIMDPGISKVLSDIRSDYEGHAL